MIHVEQGILNPESSLLLSKDGPKEYKYQVPHRSIRSLSSCDKSFENRRLGALTICFIAYFNVCGGPWGSEEIISSIGPLPGIVGIFLVSIFWAFPLALITAEMSSRFPKNGGYSIWVTEALGDFWGFQESYWSWVSGVIDNAVYPVLAVNTLTQFIDIEATYSLKLLTAILFSIPTFFSFESLGENLLRLFAFILFPFICFIVHSFAFPLSLSNLLIVNTNSPGSFWKGLLDLVPVLYWNFSGLDCVSTYAGEVVLPKKNYVKGLLYSLCLIILTYVLTLAAAVIVSKNDDWMLWTEGSLIKIVDQRLGHVFGVWVVLSSVVANFAMHCSELFEDSWQLAKYDTPIVATFLSLIIICALVILDFQQIIVVNNFFSVLSALLEIFSFLIVRSNKGKFDVGETKYYNVPIESGFLLYVFVSLPILMGTFILLSSMFNSTFALIIDIVALALGPVFYACWKEVVRFDE